jgi:hypothetical protein
MTLEGRDQDLVVRDPDHGQTKSHLVLLLLSKMTPRIFFFFEVTHHSDKFYDVLNGRNLVIRRFWYKTSSGTRPSGIRDKNSFLSAGRLERLNGIGPRVLWSGRLFLQGYLTHKNLPPWDPSVSICLGIYRGTSLTRKRPPLGPYRSPVPRDLL